jgi:type VI secretion system protein ImpK
MAEETKQAVDPDATVAQPVKLADPEATVTQPLQALDPDATVTQPAADPEATVSGPVLKLDPDATDRRPAFDPDATDRRPAFDPDSTVRRPPAHALARKNPFAPKSPPETIQANLASLGGVNPLVAMANPILAAVPQIRRTLRHPDPAALLASLRDQIEGLEASAISGEVAEDTLDTMVFALCALLDESAAATPWGQDWLEQGLLQKLRGESGGAVGFHARLDRVCAEPEKNADLVEFFYVCLALGFEGRHRGSPEGRQALQQERDRLYELIARRRPRPDTLSEHWRTPAAQAAAEAALRTVERANAARAAAAAAAAAPRVEAAPGRFALSRWPRRAIWSAVGGIVGVSLVLYLATLRLQDDETHEATAPVTQAAPQAAVAGQAPAAVPAPSPSAAAAQALAKALAGLPVAVSESGGTVALRIADDRQFAPGSGQPSPEVRAIVQRIAAALDRLPGAILVIGHADATPPRTGTNAGLSAARARAVAQVLANALADPTRVAAEGRGDTEPLASNDSDANRAKNRRVAILLRSAP